MKAIVIIIVALFMFTPCQKKKAEIDVNCFENKLTNIDNGEFSYFLRHLLVSDWLSSYSPQPLLSKQELIKLSSQLWQEMLWLRDAEILLKNENNDICANKRSAEIFLNEKYKIRAEYLSKTSHYIRIINSYEYISYNINILDSKIESLEKTNKDMRDYVMVKN